MAKNKEELTLERIHPRLPSDLVDELRDYCKANGNMDREYVVSQALREFLDRRKQKKTA
ncbi:MAG TPA: hypothetical protein VK789_09415 [Bryobacteraceae bacterium]|jgi:metal-responsive CopG/Arc/MetJ family transcriptional regulator|nr:hypothetical protein [Bryobacteraceae bacterium]